MLCKSEGSLCQYLALCQVYHNCVLPHASLARRWLSPLEATGVARQAMAAVHAGDGGWTHRSGLELVRSTAVPRAAMATDEDGLSTGSPLMIVTLYGWSGLRGRPNGQDEGLQAGFESG